MNASRTWTCAEIAARLGGSVAGDGSVTISGLQTVDDARDSDVTFIADKKHAAGWTHSGAAAAVVSGEVDLPDDPLSRPIIRVPDAMLASFDLLDLFMPEPIRPEPGVHASAIVDPTAEIARGVAIGAHVSIGPGCAVGADTMLHAGVRLGGSVAIGDDCILHSNVVVRDRTTIGNRVILHQNVSIGADGFGYRPTPDGSGLMKAPHIGTVAIEDDVEIGAGSCIDRGKFGATRIGRGTKIDNLVQIGHNCRIGCDCVIAAQAGLSGSVVVEDGAMIGGQVGVKDHVTIGAGAQVAAQSGIMRDVEPGGEVMGYPAVSIREFLRMHAVLRTLSDSPGRSRRRRSEDVDNP